MNCFQFKRPGWLPFHPNASWSRWLIVVTYAVAMAWVEAAVVYYLRTMFDRIDPHQTNPLPIVGGVGTVELIREAATLLMLLTIGLLAGRDGRSRFGYAALAFGVWDIFYYVSLKAMCGWPGSLLDWDVLFLLPLPWWGPVLAPISIALLMILWGTLASQLEHRPVKAGRGAWVLSGAGMILALYLFMADAIGAARHGLDAVLTVLPQYFNWPLFSVALAFMAAPVIQSARQLRPPASEKGLEPNSVA